MRWFVLAAAVTWASGCSFDVNGLGEAGDDGIPGTDPSAPGSTTAPMVTTSAGASTDDAGSITEGVDPPTGGGTTTTGEPMPETTLPGTVTSDASSTGPDDPSTGMLASTGEPDETTSTSGDPPDPPDPCETPSFKQIVLVANATVQAPMETFQSNLENSTAAWSGVAESGTVTFTFNVECPGTYRLFGRVYDRFAGANQNDPDSYHVRVDDGEEILWIYGCQTDEGPSHAFHWLRTRRHPVQYCSDVQDWTVDLQPGMHTIQLRNRESEVWHQGAYRRAAVARMMLTNTDYFPVAPGD